MRGVWLPVIINFLTKASCKDREEKIHFQTSHVSNADILLLVLNVAIKASCLSTMLPKHRSPYLKAGLFLLICGYDTLESYLFKEDYFSGIFPQPTDTMQKQSWCFLAGLNAAFMLFIAYRHRKENRPVDLELSTLSTSITTTSTDTQSTSTLTWVVNQLQLPLKFIAGVTAFFYGIQLAQEKDWPLQLPLSSLFYGSAMAIMQLLCNQLKKENNKQLIAYGLVCGASEGIAYYSALRFMPQMLPMIVKSLLVGTITSTSIYVSGNMLCHLFEKNHEINNRDNQPEYDNSLPINHAEVSTATQPTYDSII